ncbi:hypothetical protein D9M68_581530 [compost metagenome]
MEVQLEAFQEPVPLRGYEVAIVVDVLSASLFALNALTNQLIGGVAGSLPLLQLEFCLQRRLACFPGKPFLIANFTQPKGQLLAYREVFGILDAGDALGSTFTLL